MRKKRDDDDSLAKDKRKMDVEEIHQFIPVASLGGGVTEFYLDLQLTPGLTIPAFLAAPINKVWKTDLFWDAYSIEYLIQSEE